jgi:hypothetical protein
MSDIEAKEALKEALKEWMDDKFASFGKWTAGALAAMALTAIVYGLITIAGYHK